MQLSATRTCQKKFTYSSIILGISKFLNQVKPISKREEINRDNEANNDWNYIHDENRHI